MLLSDLDVIIKTAELGNITAAATKLDMQVATASAAIKRVEKSLGFEVFVRSTRKLRLSTAGEKYLPQCVKAHHLLKSAKQSALEDLGVMEGVLRITMPSDLGRNIVSPWIDGLMDKYPRLQLNAVLGDSPLDFYRDFVDVALRYGAPHDSRMVGFKICDVPRVLCASPDYLKQHGKPLHPQDLSNHNGLFYQLYDRTHDLWEFHKDEEKYVIKMQGNRRSNDGELVHRWCALGKGLALKSCLDMSSDLLSGRVIACLPDYKPKGTELWLMLPSRQLITPVVRVLRDSLIENCLAILRELKKHSFIF